MKVRHHHKNHDVEALCKKALAIVNAGPPPSVLIKPPPTGTNPLERAAAMYYQKIRPNYLAGYFHPGQRQFIFRCFYVPVFCKTAIEFYVKREGKPRYWLAQHGTYVLACSSTLVSRAILEIKNSGMRLQIWRSRFIFEAAGTLLFLFFIPAVWQGETKCSSFFLKSYGMAVKRRRNLEIKTTFTRGLSTPHSLSRHSLYKC